MAIPNEPLTRAEQYLNRTATGEGTIPDEPLTRVEQYLAKIAGEDVTVPDVPYTRIEQYLAYIAENGGGGNPNTQQTIQGTMANPWGDVIYSDLAAALYNGNAHANMRSASGNLPLLSNNGRSIYVSNASIGATIADSAATEVIWDDNGSVNYIHIIAGDQYQDYTAYVAEIQTNLTIYWHPMPD